MNEKFQKAIRGEEQPCPPVWFMRQAGRYHSHYQALKQKHDFLTLCRDPKLACEVALGPVLDFDFDVAILFSDLLFPLEAMGMGLSYNPGPVLSHTLNDENIKKLKSADEAVAGVQFQGEAMRLTREKLPKHKSLIGFVGGPWTLFTYAVEGAHKGSLETSKRQQRLYRDFCARLLPLLKMNIELQLKGGAEVVMIFDTSAGELDPALFSELVVPSLKEIIGAFPGRVGYYAKGIQPVHLRDSVFLSKDLAGVGYDHRWDLTQVMKAPRLNHGFIQGGIDQALLFLKPDEFEERARAFLKPIKALGARDRSGWVAGLGHGVLPGTPEANVRRYVQLIREVFV